KGPWNGGTLSTAGNLVFQGTAAGTFDAYRADNGKHLWSMPVQTGIIAAPITYMVDGEQYVAVMAGWGGVWDVATGVLADKSGPTRNISRLLVFKIGGKGALPAAKPNALLPLDPPPVTGTPRQIAAGTTLFGRYCSTCHGDAAVAGALNPDLRHSPMIADADAFRAIVIGGMKHSTGMISFAAALKDADAEAIRHYIIKRANEDKALQEQGKPAPR
ncbi:MAG: c-type cytochrome, partial [Sphingomonadales bacterium]